MTWWYSFEHSWRKGLPTIFCSIPKQITEGVGGGGASAVPLSLVMGTIHCQGVVVSYPDMSTATIDKHLPIFGAMKGSESFRKHRKIPVIISPGLIFVQKSFLLGLFLGELIFGGVYYWKEFCISKWVGLDNKNS